MPFDPTMLAYCGLYCEQCCFKVTHDERDARHLEHSPYSFSPDRFSECACAGCKTDNNCGPCNMRTCAIEKDLDHCANCDTFPCAHILRFERDDRPHHTTAIENLRAIRRLGTERWYAQIIAPTLNCAVCGQRQSWYFTCPCTHKPEDSHER